MTIVQRASELWSQLVLIDVAQQVCDRAQHHHLKVQTKSETSQRTLCTISRFMRAAGFILPQFHIKHPLVSLKYRTDFLQSEKFGYVSRSCWRTYDWVTQRYRFIFPADTLQFQIWRSPDIRSETSDCRITALAYLFQQSKQKSTRLLGRVRHRTFDSWRWGLQTGHGGVYLVVMWDMFGNWGGAALLASWAWSPLGWSESQYR